jgi:acyl-CoA synthetase (AMP-forming)/AMP-acid ligase II
MKTNIAEFFGETSILYSDRTAVVSQGEKNRRMTFGELGNMTDAYACEFRRTGIAKGTKVLMMLRPGADFIAAVFAVFKIGAIPVLIDPGMGLKNLLNCIRKTSPEAMIGISKAHWIKYFFPFFFSTVRISIVHGAFAPPWITKLESLLKKNIKDTIFKCEETKLDDTAAIVFTTGSTGPPKGVVYTHGIYIAQLDIIRRTYGAGPSEIDLPAFPLFALFSIAAGMGVVIPDMDPSRPANVDPEKIIEAVTKNNVTFSFGSPALWRKVSSYCIEKNIRLPSLKKVLMAGAPINSDVHAAVKKIISPEGETLVPYGATEALPIANFAGTEMLAETAEKTADGAGHCIGRPIAGMTIKIIAAVNGPIENWSPSLELRQGSKGEIVVKGPVVTPCYFNEPEHTRNAKIADTDGKIWHRMGDIGYYDVKGRLWFCGRKAHRVITKDGILYSVCCEAIFNRHPDVSRCALVGVGPEGKQTPVIIIEPKSGKMPVSKEEKLKFIDELNDLGADHDFTLRISQFLFHPSFPVDIRHNAKIFREQLAEWAAGKA